MSSEKSEDWRKKQERFVQEDYEAREKRRMQEERYRQEEYDDRKKEDDMER